MEVRDAGGMSFTHDGWMHFDREQYVARFLPFASFLESKPIQTTNQTVVLLLQELLDP